MRNIIKNTIKSSLMTFVPRKRILWKGKRNSRNIALTFDDGPDPLYTPQILNILNLYKVPATFFLIGSKIKKHSDIANEILNQGHIIGSHAYSHIELNKLDSASIELEIDRTEEMLNTCINYESSIFRPPHGIVNLSLLGISLRRKLTLVLWSVDSMDYCAESTETIIKNVDPDKVRCGDIILLHDNNHYTIEALPILIDKLRGKGFEFSTILSMLED